MKSIPWTWTLTARGKTNVSALVCNTFFRMSPSVTLALTFRYFQIKAHSRWFFWSFLIKIRFENYNLKQIHACKSFGNKLCSRLRTPSSANVIKHIIAFFKSIPLKNQPFRSRSEFLRVTKQPRLHPQQWMTIGEGICRLQQSYSAHN